MIKDEERANFKLRSHLGERRGELKSCHVRVTVVSCRRCFVSVLSHCRPYSCVVMRVQFVAIKFRKFQNHGGESLSWLYRPHSSSVVSLTPLVASRSYHIRHCCLTVACCIWISSLLCFFCLVSVAFRIIFASFSSPYRIELSSHYFQDFGQIVPPRQCTNTGNNETKLRRNIFNNRRQ